MGRSNGDVTEPVLHLTYENRPGPEVRYTIITSLLVQVHDSKIMDPNGNESRDSAICEYNELVNKKIDK